MHEVAIGQVFDNYDIDDIGVARGDTTSSRSMPTTGMPGVRLRGLTKMYLLTNNQKKVAVNNLELDFNVGEVTSLLGHNGAGKSTTL